MGAPQEPEFGEEKPQPEGHHGRHGGKGHHGHHKKHHSCFGSIMWMMIIAAHFYFLHKLGAAQAAVEKLTKKGEKKQAVVHVQQQPIQIEQPIAVVSPSPVTSA